MPIINQVIPYLTYDQNVDYRDQNSIFSMSHFEGFQYYWVEYANDSSLAALKKAIPEDILKKIKQGNLTLVLYHSHEGSVFVVEPIYQHAVIELGIPEDNIHVYTESPTLTTVIQETATKLNKKPFRCFNIRVFESFAKNGIEHLLTLDPNRPPTLKKKLYSKKFLNFNRRWRWHRPAMVAHLFLENLLDLGYVSLGECEGGHGWDNAWDMMLKTHSHHPELRQKFIDNKDRIFSIPPLYLDQENLNINHVGLLDSTFDLYSNTYFSLVSETNFFKAQEPALFLTEKIFKPIAHKHPFIVLSRPKTLMFLKDLGYKTFESIIDESYDNELDDVTRMMKILKEVNRLCYMSNIELNNFLTEAKDICDYNYNILRNKTEFVKEITNDFRY